MKTKNRNLTPNKYPKGKIQNCSKCGKILDKEDLKLGCARCEWESIGHDVPDSRKHYYESRDNRGTNLESKEVS